MDHPVNLTFVNSLDRINAIAEAQQGFVWRLTGDGNNALDIQVFEDPDIAVNMSVWTDMESLASFVYRNREHAQIMRRRREWFDKIDFYLVLWWIEAGHIPTVDEAIDRLNFLKANGPTRKAFTFSNPFASPAGEDIKPIMDKCA